MYIRYDLIPRERPDTVAVRYHPDDAKELYEAGWIDDIDNDFGVPVGVVRIEYPSTDEFRPPREIHYRAFPGMWIVKDDDKRRVLTAHEREKEWEQFDVTEVTPATDEQSPAANKGLIKGRPGHEPIEQVYEFEPNPTPAEEAEPGHSTGKGIIDSDDPHGVPEAMPVVDVDEMDEQTKAVAEGNRKYEAPAAQGVQTSYGTPTEPNTNPDPGPPIEEDDEDDDEDDE